MLDFPDTIFLTAGDFNARMQGFLDYIPKDSLEYIMPESKGYPSDCLDMSRFTMDSEIYNNYGKKLADICCIYGIHALNGRLFNDSKGNFTCVTHNGASVIDYMLASSELFSYFCDFGIHQVGSLSIVL